MAAGACEVAGEMFTDMAEVLTELRFWREALRAAGQAHDALPLAVRREIDRVDPQHELMRMVPLLAMFSSASRQRMELLNAEVMLLVDAEVTRRAAPLQVIRSNDGAEHGPPTPR